MMSSDLLPYVPSLVSEEESHLKVFMKVMTPIGMTAFAGLSADKTQIVQQCIMFSCIRTL
jgi:hypothetical protein